MQCRVVELVLHLLPDMIEEILAFLIRTIVEVCLEINILQAFCRHVISADRTVAEVKVVHVGIPDKSATANALIDQLGLIFLKVMSPQVVAAFKSRLVIQHLAFFVECKASEARRIYGQSDNTITAVIKVELQRFNLFRLYCFAFLFCLLSLLGIFLLGFLLGFLFLQLVFCLQFVHLALFLRAVELLVGVEIEEHDVHIILRAPASVRAITLAIAREEHCLAVEHPSAATIAVAALREVVQLARPISLD